MMRTLFKDMSAGNKRYRLAISLAKEDLLDRFRRSVLGVTWIIISFLLFIAVKAVIFSGFFDSEEYDFFSHLVVGFAIFGFISMVFTQSANLFFANRTWVLSSNIPYSVYMHSLAIRAFLELMLLSSASAALIILFGDPRPAHLWTLLPASILFYITAIGCCLVMAPMGVYFRDVYHATQALMRVMFFATPIIWVAEEGTLRGLVAFWNPLTYYIDIVRIPILSGKIPYSSWGVATLVTLFICIAGAILFNAKRAEIAKLL